MGNANEIDIVLIAFQKNFKNTHGWLELLTSIEDSDVKRPLSKRPKIGFHVQLSLNAGQK